VIAGGEGGKWTGVGRPLRALALSPFVSQRLTMFVSKERGSDIDALRQLIERGQMSPIIDRTYPSPKCVTRYSGPNRRRSEARSRSRFDLQLKDPGQARGLSTSPDWRSAVPESPPDPADLISGERHQEVAAASACSSAAGPTA
jgi:hypothetical protein